MEGSNQTPGTTKKSVILETNPDPRGFLSRYLLALTPLFLLVISFITTAAIRGFMVSFTPNLTGSMGAYLPGMGDMMEMSVLLTAPIGIFTLFVTIGWIMRYTEMWTSSALALGLSSLSGFLLVTFSPDTSMNRILDLLYWIAYLIQPASVAAVIIVIAWTEKFRRTIRYTVTSEGVITRGGIWKQQKHILPHHQIGRLVMEQGQVGWLLHTGTILLAGTAQRGSEMSIRGLGQEVSRSPLDCLYGIRDPEKVMALLQELISRPAGREEEQVSYPRKISEKR